MWDNKKNIQMKKHLLNRFCVLILLTSLVGREGYGQIDPHFSQYYIHPMTLNPALTGAIEGDYRLSAVWRNQYSNLFTTTGISAEAVTNKSMNFGFNLLN